MKNPSTMVMVEARLRCVIDVVGPDGNVWATRVLTGTGEPDMGDVEELARIKLSASRVGGRIVLDTVCAHLVELLELAGLPVEMRGKVERREDLLGAQERVEPDDPTT